MDTAERTRQSGLGPKRVPNDAVGTIMDAGAAATRVLLVAVGVIAMIAVLLVATADGSIIRSIGDRLADVPTTELVP